MSLLTIRAPIRPDAVEAVESAVGELFAAIEQKAPENLRYGSFRLGDGATYLVLLQVDEGTENPLPEMPEFQRFQEGLREWAAGPPEAGPAEVIASYRLL